jgi:hypothetical protein
MHRIKSFVLRGAFCATAIFAVFPLSPWAAQPVSVGESVSKGPAMDQILRMANFLAQLKQFSVTLDSGYDVVQESGQKIEFGERRQLTVVRPDRLRVDVERSDGSKAVTVFDGKAVTMFTPKSNLYATTEMPGDIDGAIIHFVKDLHMRMPLALMFVTSLPQELERRSLSADIVETTTLSGKPCVHIAGRGETVDFQFWIRTEGDPLPCKLILTYKKEEGQPQYWASFSEWNLLPNPPDSFFTLDIPKDAGRIQFLAEIPKPAKPAAKKGGKQ